MTKEDKPTDQTIPEPTEEGESPFPPPGPRNPPDAEGRLEQTLREDGPVAGPTWEEKRKGRPKAENGTEDHWKPVGGEKAE